jgi:aspartyl-tRNA synthetase
MTPVSLALHSVVDRVPRRCKTLDRARRRPSRALRARYRSNITTLPVSRRHYVTHPEFARVSCGALSANDVDRDVELSGWVHRRRDHGGLIFIDLRDRDGHHADRRSIRRRRARFARPRRCATKFVVRVAARVRRVPTGHGESQTRAPATSKCRSRARGARALGDAAVRQVSSDDDVDENVRLKYRYLDLRRPRMQRNLTVRHRIIKAMRDYFDAHEFIEIETPILIKSTPEGARDYLVPSRIHPARSTRCRSRRSCSSRS